MSNMCVFLLLFVVCLVFSQKIDQINSGLDLELNCPRSINYEERVSSAFKETNFTQLYIKESVDHKTDFTNIFYLYKNYPLIIFNNVSTIQEKCIKANQFFLEDLKQNKLNALKMLDATAKIPSGLLRGNVNQYGDFDECLEVPNAKYCLADIDLEPIWNKPLSNFKNLIHSHYPFQEDFGDPRHRVPGFKMIRWGFCIPRECSNIDLEKALVSNLGVNVRVNKEMCQISEKQSEDPSFTGNFAKYFFRSLLLLIVFSTILHNKLDYCGRFKTLLHKIVNIFSLQCNYEQLMKVNEKKIRAIDGIRSLSALALLMSHKFMALLYNPYINRTPMSENIGMGWSVIGRTAILYTDCFILISGLLNANALLNSLEKNGSMNVKQKIINRLFRITPSLLAVILFCTYYLPEMGSGPLWPLVINHHSELCKQNMWRNLFFLHNYFGFENMCLTHTHQVAIDMQLFLITPLVVFILWKNKKYGFYLLSAIGIISTILRLIVTYQRNLSPLIYFGIPISRMFDTANFSYILPTHRATIYFLGVYLAHLLKYSNSQVYFSNWKKLCLWIVFLAAGFSVWLGPVHMSRIGYKYDNFEAAIFASISPVFWGAAISWVIYATNRNCGGWLGNLLEWKHFEKVTKISYAIYLVQFPVFFYNIGKTRHVTEYTHFFIFPILEFAVIVIISIILTLLVEMPFQTIGKLLFQEKQETVKPNANEYKKIQRDCSKLG